MNKDQEIATKMFDLLVEQFVKPPKNHVVEIVFKKYLGKEEGCCILGNTAFNVEQKRISLFFFNWWPKPKVKYTISFLKSYSDVDVLRSVAIHEFTHFYIFYKSIEKHKNDKLRSDYVIHEHDDGFYSKMDQFEDWVDLKLDLPSRRNKANDWLQHTNPLQREWRKMQYSNGMFVSEEQPISYQSDYYALFGKKGENIKSPKTYVKKD